MTDSRKREQLNNMLRTSDIPIEFSKSSLTARRHKLKSRHLEDNIQFTTKQKHNKGMVKTID